MIIKMAQVQQFLVLMVAFSTAAQTLTEYVVKQFFPSLASTLPDSEKEKKRQTYLHLWCALFGAVLDWTTGLRPITDLFKNGDDLPFAWISSVQVETAVEGVVVGVMVSYGSGFFNDVLGALNAFVDAQNAIKAAAPPPPTPPKAPAAS